MNSLGANEHFTVQLFRGILPELLFFFGAPQHKPLGQ
jgi:hypothetical protein